MVLNPYKAGIIGMTAGLVAAAASHLDWVQSILVVPSPLMTAGNITAAVLFATGSVIAGWRKAPGVFGPFAAVGVLALVLPQMMGDRTETKGLPVPTLTRQDIPLYTAKIARQLSDQASAHRLEAEKYQATIADLREKMARLDFEVRNKVDNDVRAERDTLRKASREVDERKAINEDIRRQELVDLRNEQERLRLEFTKIEQERTTLVAKATAAETEARRAKAEAAMIVASTREESAKQIAANSAKAAQELASLKRELTTDIKGQFTAVTGQLQTASDKLTNNAAGNADRLGQLVTQASSSFTSVTARLEKVPEQTGVAVEARLGPVATRIAGDAQQNTSTVSKLISAVAGDITAAGSRVRSDLVQISDEAKSAHQETKSALVAARDQISSTAQRIDVAVAKVEQAPEATASAVGEQIAATVKPVRQELAAIIPAGGIAGIIASQRDIADQLKLARAGMEAVSGKVDTVFAASNLLQTVLGPNLTKQLDALKQAELAQVAAINNAAEQSKRVADASVIGFSNIGLISGRIDGYKDATVAAVQGINGRIDGLSERENASLVLINKSREEQASSSRAAVEFLAASAKTNVDMTTKFDAVYKSLQLASGQLNEASTRIANMSAQIGLIEASLKSLPKGAVTPDQLKALQVSINEAKTNAKMAGDEVTALKVSMAQPPASLSAPIRVRPGDGKMVLPPTSPTALPSFAAPSLSRDATSAPPAAPVMAGRAVSASAAKSALLSAADQVWSSKAAAVEGCKPVALDSAANWDVALAKGYPGYTVNRVDVDGHFVWANKPGGLIEPLPMVEVERTSGCKISVASASK